MQDIMAEMVLHGTVTESQLLAPASSPVPPPSLATLPPPLD